MIMTVDVIYPKISDKVDAAIAEIRLLRYTFRRRASHLLEVDDHSISRIGFSHEMLFQRDRSRLSGCSM